MIKDVKRWREWEDAYIASTPPDLARNLEIVDALYEQARALGLFPLADPDALAGTLEYIGAADSVADMASRIEGLDVKIRVAQALNVSTTPRDNSPRA